MNHTEGHLTDEAVRSLEHLQSINHTDKPLFGALSRGLHLTVRASQSLVPISVWAHGTGGEDGSKSKSSC